MIRRPISKLKSVAYAVMSVTLLLAAYTYVSYKMHLPVEQGGNPKDKTIPTWSQLAEGVVKFTRPNRVFLSATITVVPNPEYKGEKEQTQSRIEGVTFPLGTSLDAIKFGAQEGYPEYIVTGVEDVFEDWADVWILEDSYATTIRLFNGLALGVLLGFLTGILMGCIPSIEAFLQPPLSLLAKVPPTAALAVYMVFFGTGMEMYVAMISLGILPPIAVSIYLSIKDIPSEMLDKAYTLGASSFEVAMEVVFKQVLPKFIDTVRLCIGPAIVFLIAAEMLVADIGFGYRIRLQFKMTNMNVVYPYLAILAGFGFLLDYGLRALQAKVCPWYQNGAK